MGGLAAAGLVALAACAPTPASSAAETVWEVTFTRPVSVMSADAEVAIVYSSDAHTLSALHISDGETAWSIPMAPAPWSADVRDGVVIVAQPASAGRLIGGIDAGTGAALWSRTDGGSGTAYAWADGHALEATADTLRVTDRANVVRATWDAPEGCSLGQFALARNSPRGVVALVECENESVLHRLDADLHPLWTTAVGAAYEFWLRGDRVVTGTPGSDLTIVAPDGKVEATTAGAMIAGTDLFERRFEGDAIDAAAGGTPFTGWYPAARTTVGMPAVGLVLIAPSGDEHLQRVQVGAVTSLTRVRADVYVMAARVGEEGHLSRIDVRGAPSPSVTPSPAQPPEPSSLRTDALGEISLFLTGTGPLGDEAFVLTEATPFGARLGTASLLRLGSAELATGILRASITENSTEASDMVAWQGRSIEAAQGSCALSITLDGEIPAPEDAAAMELADAVFGSDTTGACTP